MFVRQTVCTNCTQLEFTYRKIFCYNEGKKLDFDDVVERAECIENERQKRLCMFTKRAGKLEIRVRW